MDQAEKYSDLALKSDRYNARAYVNKVCVFVMAVMMKALRGGSDLAM